MPNISTNMSILSTLLIKIKLIVSHDIKWLTVEKETIKVMQGEVMNDFKDVNKLTNNETSEIT